MNTAWLDGQAHDEASATELAHLAGPLTDSELARLTDFYDSLIAEAGADVPSTSEIPPPGAARAARRVARQRADRFVRVLSAARRTAEDEAAATGVAA